MVGNSGTSGYWSGNAWSIAAALSIAIKIKTIKVLVATQKPISLDVLVMCYCHRIAEVSYFINNLLNAMRPSSIARSFPHVPYPQPGLPTTQRQMWMLPRVWIGLFKVDVLIYA